MAATGYFSHPACHQHNMGRGHPECPERLAAIEERLIATGVMDALQRFEAPQATRDQLLRGHTSAHVGGVHAASEKPLDGLIMGGAQWVQLDPDTAMGEHTHEAALRAAGAVLAATDAVVRGTLANAFCAVRPPGHHAVRAASMGFCVFSNVALGALHALAVHGLSRVAVVDFDVHHGNGTEDVLRGNRKALMVGFFQSPFYPYSGGLKSAPNVSNVPVAAYTGGERIRELFQEHCIAPLDAFKPELIFVSAGFDAHREDTLGQLGLVDGDYRWMTEEIMGVAQRHAKGRIVSSLEGGYSLDALARSVEQHLRALAGL